jgi:hypothetical protein
MNRLIGFEQGTGYKKYNALILSTAQGKIKKIPFGDKRYQQYHDKIGLYSHLDHNDEIRRLNYKKRHKNDKLNEFSPGYFSWYYLW